MASLAVMTAVKARLQTWAGLATYPLADLNVEADSPTTKYLRVEYPVADEERMSLGKPALFRETGAIRFVLNVATLSGLDDVLAAVEELRDLFRDEDFAGLMTGEASPAEFDRNSRNGTFYEIPFVVVYQFDYEK